MTVQADIWTNITAAAGVLIGLMSVSALNRVLRAPNYDRPMIIANSGPLVLLAICLVVYGGLLSVLIWSYLKLSFLWFLLVVFGVGVGWLIVDSALTVVAPVLYGGLFPAVGTLLGSVLLVVFNCLIWIGPLGQQT